MKENKELRTQLERVKAEAALKKFDVMMHISTSVFHYIVFYL